MFCRWFCALSRRGWGKCIFYPILNQWSMPGESVILPFLLSCDNDNFFSPRIPSADALAKDKERMEKYQGAGPGQPPWDGRFVNGPAPGAFLFGVWPGAEQTQGRGRGEKRQTGGGQATPTKSCLPLPSARGVNI